MRLLNLLAVTAAAILPVFCASAYNFRCSNPLVRKEWRNLDNQEKHEYIEAVKCLTSRPSQTRSIHKSAKSRFDDFQATHIAYTDFVHYVGFFQPWHRMLVAQYEKDLRNLCGYTGAQPYWNWALDSNSAEDFLSSPIFDKVTGLGGNGIFVNTTGWNNLTRQVPGKTGGGCVIDGPFALESFMVNLGPGNSSSYNPRCLVRDIAPEFAISKLNQCIVDWTLEADDFYEFDRRVQGGITADAQGYHGGGHLGVGGDTGELSDMYSSPGDPIFFLHHANIDRLWDQWQRLGWHARRRDIGGPDTQYAYPYNFFGDKAYKNVTIDYNMGFGNLIPGKQYVTVKDVMDTQGGKLCYTYE